MQPTGRHLAPPFLPPQAPPPLNAKLICPRRKHISICSTSVFRCIVIQCLPLIYINMYTRMCKDRVFFTRCKHLCCSWYTFLVFHPFQCFQSDLFLQIFLPCSWTKVICDPVKCPITDSTLPLSTLHPLLLRAKIDIVKSWKTWRGKSRSWENFLQGKRLLRPVGLAVQFCECEFVSMINREVVYEINALLPSVQKD